MTRRARAALPADKKRAPCGQEARLFLGGAGLLIDKNLERY